MAEIKLADFGTGMDTRRSASTSNPKSFRDIENCHITTGRTLKKRGGFKHIATLPANTAGLMAQNGALNIFKVTPNTTAFPTVPAANVATAIHGDTTPFITHELERTSPNMTAFTAATRAGNQALNAYDVRHVHFAESFNAIPYVIVEHWDGSKSHHFLNRSTLRQRARTWKVGVSAVTKGVFFNPHEIVAVPFVFMMESTDDRISDPIWGLKNYALREMHRNTVLAQESEALYNIARKPAIQDPFTHPIYLEFHSGSPLPPAVLVTGTPFVGLDPLQLPFLRQLPAAGGVAAKDTDQFGRVFAENAILKTAYKLAIYLMQAEYSKLLTSQSFFLDATQKRLAALQAVYNAAKADYDAKANKSTAGPGGAVRRRAAAEALKVLNAASAALSSYASSNHTDGGVDANVSAALALCKWKMDAYIAAMSASLAEAAPSVVAGDAVYLNDNYPLSYAIATDPNETRYTQIKDSDLNQNNTIALNIASKLFVADGDRVQFSQTDDPTRWFFDPSDPALDSGWLPVGIKQSGVQQVTAMGQQLGKLVVFFADSAQVWAVDPDPKLMAFNQAIEGVGTSHRYSIANISNDATFLHRTGFRSISTMQFNNNLTDLDVGSAIDKPVVAHLAAASLRQDTDTSALAAGAIIDLATINETKVIAKTLGSLGQYWCAIGADIWVFTYSKVGKVAGWSRYTLPYEVQEITELNGTVYIRAGVDVYAYDPALLVDEVDGAAGTSVAVAASASFQYLSAKAAGRMKMFHSFDSIVIGAADMRFKFDVRNPAIETAAVPLTGDSNPDYLTPMQVSSTHISPVISSLQHFELEYLALYFNMLGRR